MQGFMVKQIGSLDKRIPLIWSLILLSFSGISQQQSSESSINRQGKAYFYWGWNRSGYTNSNINFKGSNYEFTLYDVNAKDRQSPFSFNTYYNPSYATVPQYNFRIGYFLKENWDVSFGIDHMKYVVQQGQQVKISGDINVQESNFSGIYSNSSFQIAPDFLKFEHTDGLNYVNLELRRSDKFLEWNEVKVYFLEGLGTGVLIPKTNVTLLSKERHDNFHLSGYGISALVGINITFFNTFFIQAELKGGFINMPHIRTTRYKEDKASQHFFFVQSNIVLGGVINLKKK